MKKEINFEPMFDKILIEKDFNEKKEIKTDSGIILQKTKRDELQNAKVLKVGPECKYIKIDDIVMISTMAGSQITIDDKMYHLIDERNVLGTVKEYK